MAYVTIGTFVGSGIIADGHLWEGAKGSAANLGAILVGDGTRAPQHVHMMASLYALEQRIIAAGLDLPSGPHDRWDWPLLEPVVSEWLEDAGKWLSLAIVNARAVTEFELAIIDGVLPSTIMDRLVARVEANLGALPVLDTDHPRVAKGMLGESAAAMGAALMPIYRRYFSRKAADTGL